MTEKKKIGTKPKEVPTNEKTPESVQKPEWLAVDWDKVFDTNPAIAIRNIILILEAIDISFATTCVNIDKVKHMLKL